MARAPQATRRRKTRNKAADAPERDSPLLDLSDQAVKRLLKTAKAKGYVTLDQLNAVAALGRECPSDQIEDIMAMLSDMGINVVETDEAEEAAEGRGAGRGRGKPRAGGAERARQDRDQGRARRAHRRSRAHVPARNGLGRAAVARRRNRHRQAHRGRPRGHDRRAVRKPADVPGHHHLARRAERRQDSAARHHRSRSDLRRPRGQESRPPVGEDGMRRRSRRPRGAPRRPGGRRRDGERRRRRIRERHVARRHGSGTEAEGSRNLRQDRRHLQEAAQAAGQEARTAGRRRTRLAPAAEGLRQAARRNHRRRQIAVAQQQPYRKPRRAALRHQQAPDRPRRPPDALGRQLRRAAPALHRRILRQRTRPDLARPHVDQRQEVGAVRQERAHRRSSNIRGEIHSSRPRPASKSPSSAASSKPCRRASAKPARPRRKWSKPTFASSSRSPRNTPTAACSSSISSRKATSA